MADRFDFEQDLLDCWNVTKDINTLYVQIADHGRLSDDELMNVLLGLKQLYDMKFNQLFDQFEALIKEKKL